MTTVLNENRCARAAFFEGESGMTLIRLILALGPFASIQAAYADPIWATVPAIPNSQSLGRIRTPMQFPDNLICNVESADSSAGAARELSSFGGSEITNRNDPAFRETDLVEPPVPLNALWPDKNGTIVVTPLNVRNGAFECRNPWEICSSGLSNHDASTLKSGGTVVGGAGGAVAFVNGRIVRRGDVIGVFEVLSVLPIGIVFKGGGVFFVVPRGRCVVVKSADG